MNPAAERPSSPLVPTHAGMPARLPWPAGLLRMEGTYRSHCVILPLEDGPVDEMLAPGLSRAPQTLTPAGRHPVLFMFGHHSGVRPTFLRIAGGSYDELVVAVPFLALERRAAAGVYRGPFSYMPRLFLNAWLWVVLGWFYGYPKVRARIRSKPDSYAVGSLLRGRAIVSATYSPRGEAAPAKDFPFFERVAPVFRQPFVSHVLGFAIGSVMTFHLDRATLQAVDMRVDIQDPFLPGLAVETFEAKGIDTGSLGAFRIEVPWTLSFPFPCGRLKEPVP